MEREVSEVDRKLLLKKTYLDKINYHITRNPISQEELYPLVRHFFGEYLKLDYEFTYEELSQELNKVFIRPKVKEHIDNFLIRLSESEYLEENSLGSKEINAFLNELADLIMNVISEEQAAIKEEDSLISKILKKKHADTRLMDLTGMNALIDELNFHITSGNLDSSKRLYVDLLKTYDDMPKNDKKKLHDAMNDVYERLQTLMKNPEGVTNVRQQSAQSSGVSNDAKKVMGLADEISFYINASNADAAKKMYSDALKLYESLNPDERKALRPHLNELYSQLQALSSKPSKTRSASADAIPIIKHDMISGAVATKVNADTRVVDNKTVDNNMHANNVRAEVKDSVSKVIANTANTSTAANITAANTVENFVSAIENVASSVSGANSNATAIHEMTSNKDHSSQNLNLTFVGDSAAALLRKETDITSAGDLFDYSIEKSPNNAQSLADEEVDAYRRPLIDDAESGVELDGMLGDMSSLESGLEQDYLLNVNEDAAANVKMDSKDKTKNLKNKKVQFFDSDVFSASKSSEPESGNVLFSFSQASAPSIIESVKDAKSELQRAELQGAELQKVGQRLVKSATGPNVVKLKNEKKDTVKKDILENAKPEHIIPPASNILVFNSPDSAIATTSAIAVSKTSESTDVMQPAVSKPSKPLHVQTSKSLDTLSKLLGKINDDILMDKLDKAKSTYKEALLAYRSLRDAEKALCYKKFNETFMRLDAALHQKSLHNILETHLSESKHSQRAVISKESISAEPYSPESSRISVETTLPIIINADAETTRVYELIEESYFNMDNNNYDLAMLKYFKALELYRDLPANDRKKSYRDLYNLFKRLSLMKNTVNKIQ